MWSIVFTLFSLLSFGHAATTTNRFIVEVAPDSSPDNAMNEITGSFQGMPHAPSVSTKFTYNSEYFRGLSFSVTSASNSFTYDSLTTHFRQLQHVEAVYSVKRIALSPIRQMRSAQPQVLLNPPTMPAVGSATNVHRGTGVAQLHDLGFRGANTTIAILDTGADYLNQFLSGGIGPGHRITYGIDLTGDSIRPPHVATPDGDPYSECQAHGTHVAGIIGAVGPPDMNLVGVAPEANLELYRVFDCEGITETDIVVDAVLKAAARNVDVMNLSLGGGGPFEEDAISAVMSRINLKGTTYCLASMGNDGQNGTFTSQAPGAGVDVPAIGSSAPFESKYPTYYANYTVGDSPNQLQFEWLPSDSSIFPHVLQLYVLNPDPNVQDDACIPLPPNSPDLSNVLILVKRGSCTWAQKMENLAVHGGKYILFYNSEASNDQIGIGETTNGTVVAGISGNDGIALASYGSTQRVLVTMNTTEYANSALLFPNDQYGGRMSVFSSIGPPALGFLKPTFAAPGDNILSTVPRKDGFFDNLSGTSMAAPYAAGTVALLKKARPGLTFRQITTLLATTAKPVQFSDGSNTSYPFLAPAWQQGGGTISAFDAYQCQTLLDTEALSFNDTAHFEPQISFTVRNLGNQPQSYQLANINAVTIRSFFGNGNPNPIQFFYRQEDTTPNPDFITNLTPDYATIGISPQSFDLAPGAMQTVTVTADISQHVGIQSACPLFSGWIAINGTTDRVTLPWGAIGCSLYDLPIIDPNDPMIYLVAADNETEYNATLKETHPLPPIEANRVFVVPRDNSSEAQLGVVYPWLQYKFSMYTRFANIDLLDANGNKVANLLNTSTKTDQERLPVAFQNFTGLLPWGVWADEGQYRFNLSAMRVFGDPNVKTDFREFYISDPFILQYGTPGTFQASPPLNPPVQQPPQPAPQPPRPVPVQGAVPGSVPNPVPNTAPNTAPDAVPGSVLNALPQNAVQQNAMPPNAIPGSDNRNGGG